MRNIAILSASAFVLALGVGAASAEPFNPVTGYHGSSVEPAYGYNGGLTEGRAAAEDGFNNGWTNAWTHGNPVLEQFHESGR
jgi:hypothetical protein